MLPSTLAAWLPGHPTSNQLSGFKAEQSRCLLLRSQANGSMPGTSGQNGTAHSNGAVLEAQFTDRRSSSSNGAASSNGSGNGAYPAAAASGGRAGRSALIQEVTEADSLAQRLATGSYAGAASSNGAGVRAEERPEHWADPCEVGHLEACAQERYAGAGRPRAGMLASPGQNYGITPTSAAPACAARALLLLAP